MKNVLKLKLIGGASLAVMASSVPQISFAQTAPTADQDEIIVIGSRRAQSRSTLSAPVPD